MTRDMSLSIHPELESRIRARAEAEGITSEAYLDRLVQADQRAIDELESLALEGLESGSPIEASLSYWQEKHRQLDERLKKTDTR